GREDAASQRRRRHRAVPQARPQPAARRDVHGDRAGRRARADRLRRVRGRAAGLSGADVRLWLRDDERQPDPVPVATDDRAAVLAGLALWVVALVVVLIVAGALGAALGLWLWTIGVGIALGLVG